LPSNVEKFILKEARPFRHIDSGGGEAPSCGTAAELGFAAAFAREAVGVIDVSRHVVGSHVHAELLQFNVDPVKEEDQYGIAPRAERVEEAATFLIVAADEHAHASAPPTKFVAEDVNEEVNRV